MLSELRFESALRSLAEQILDEHHIQLRLRMIPARNRFIAACIILFYAVRETLMNVIKHSDAHHVQISLRRELDTLIITIADDGKGFDISASGKHQSASTGFGLFSLRERLSYLGGTLAIHSVPDKGTTITMQTKLQQ